MKSIVLLSRTATSVRKRCFSADNRLLVPLLEFDIEPNDAKWLIPALRIIDDASVKSINWGVNDPLSEEKWAIFGMCLFWMSKSPSLKLNSLGLWFPSDNEDNALVVVAKEMFKAQASNLEDVFIDWRGMVSNLPEVSPFLLALGELAVFVDTAGECAKVLHSLKDCQCLHKIEMSYLSFEEFSSSVWQPLQLAFQSAWQLAFERTILKHINLSFNTATPFFEALSQVKWPRNLCCLKLRLGGERPTSKWLTSMAENLSEAGVSGFTIAFRNWSEELLGSLMPLKLSPKLQMLELIEEGDEEHAETKSLIELVKASHHLRVLYVPESILKSQGLQLIAQSKQVNLRLAKWSDQKVYLHCRC